jgi:hypothetical protein
MALDSNSSSNSSHDNVPNSNTQQQQPPMFHWPYFPPSATQAVAPWQLQLPHTQQGSQVFRPPQLFGANIPPIFQTFNGDGWQSFEATSPTTHNLVPNMCYHAGYTFPGLYATFSLHKTCTY